MTWQDDTRKELASKAGEWATTVADDNGVGTAQRALLAGAATAGVGFVVSLGLDLLTDYLGSAEPTLADVLKALNKIHEQLDDMSDRLVDIGISMDQAQGGPVLVDAVNVEAAATELIKRMHIPNTQVDAFFDDLGKQLGQLEDSMAAMVTTLQGAKVGGFWWDPFVANYPKMPDGYRWDTLVGDPFWWGLTHHPDPKFVPGAASQVPDSLSGSRPDHRPLLEPLLAGVHALIYGRTVFDPAMRTNGHEGTKQNFRMVAAGLRVLAERMLGGIKLTRPINLPMDYDHLIFGRAGPWPNNNIPKGRILRDGWPVGAVDTVSGMNSIETHWRPSEHGFPELSNPQVLEFPSSFISARVKNAVEESKRQALAAWAKLAMVSGAFELFDLADQCDELATYPRTSETVWDFRQQFSSRRHDSGSKMLESPFRGIQVLGDACGSPEAARVTYVDQRTEVTIGIQPDRWRHTDINPSQHRTSRIAYRYFIEAAEVSLEGIPSTPLSTVAPSPPQRAHLDAEVGQLGTVQLLVPTFSYITSSAAPVPAGGGWVANAGDQHASNQAIKVVSWLAGDESGPQRSGWSTMSQAWIGGVGVDVNGGRLEPKGQSDFKLSYTRQDEDGEVTFAFEHIGEPVNAILWLVAEEPYGMTKDGSPEGHLRTGCRLAFIGEELRVSPTYFEQLEQCRNAWSTLMGRIMKPDQNIKLLDGRGPFPDPRVDLSPRAYVERLNRLIRTL